MKVAPPACHQPTKNPWKASKWSWDDQPREEGFAYQQSSTSDGGTGSGCCMADSHQMFNKRAVPFSLGYTASSRFDAPGLLWSQKDEPRQTRVHRWLHQQTWGARSVLLTHHYASWWTQSLPAWHCSSTGYVVPLRPLVWCLDTWLALPIPSRWLLRPIRLRYAIQFARCLPKFSGVISPLYEERMLLSFERRLLSF